MNDGRKIDRKFMVLGLALLVVFLLGAEAPLSAQRSAQSTRSSGGGKAPTVSRTSNTSAPASNASSGGSASRSAAPRASATPKAANTRQSTPANRGRHRRSSGYRPYRHHLGVSFGYGGYYGWGGHYGYYPYSFYPFYWGVPYYTPYYTPRRAYRQYELGAFDLNVRPKKAEVYLDGQYIGTAGQYDGFPDHLWLEQGSYELIFYRPGLATERRVLSVYPGVVVDVRLRLEPGESVAPEELTRAARPEGAMAEVRSAYRQQVRAAPSEAPSTAPAKAELDTRAAPGRVRLSVLPADASVYLDGRLLGSGNELARLHAGLVVDAGSHLIEVVRPGYATERLEFAVDPGGDVELEVLLEAG